MSWIYQGMSDDFLSILQRLGSNTWGKWSVLRTWRCALVNVFLFFFGEMSSSWKNYQYSFFPQYFQQYVYYTLHTAIVSNKFNKWDQYSVITTNSLKAIDPERKDFSVQKCVELRNTFTYKQLILFYFYI